MDQVYQDIKQGCGNEQLKQVGISLVWFFSDITEQTSRELLLVGLIPLILNLQLYNIHRKELTKVRSSVLL